MSTVLIKDDGIIDEVAIEVAVCGYRVVALTPREREVAIARLREVRWCGWHDLGNFHGFKGRWKDRPDDLRPHSAAEMAEHLGIGARTLSHQLARYEKGPAPRPKLSPEEIRRRDRERQRARRAQGARSAQRAQLKAEAEARSASWSNQKEAA